MNDQSKPQTKTGPLFPFKALVYFLGCVVIALALASYLTELDAGAIFKWLQQRFTSGFLALLSFFLFTGFYGVMRLDGSEKDGLWQEYALQSANAVATLALTFTLLGISLGIGSLSQQTISPESVGSIIQNLTQHFSVAFMTTVVGLPLATAIRALTQLRAQRIRFLSHSGATK